MKARLNVAIQASNLLLLCFLSVIAHAHEPLLNPGPTDTFDPSGWATSARKSYFGAGLDGVSGSRDKAGDFRWFMTDLVGGVTTELLNANHCLPQSSGNPSPVPIDYIDTPLFGSSIHYPSGPQEAARVDATFTRRAFGQDWGDLVPLPSRWSPTASREKTMAGRWHDADTGLVTMRHRHYDPATGRFTQRDPILHGGGVNMYAYAGGNPVSNRDPLGLDYTYVNRAGVAFCIVQKPATWRDWLNSAANRSGVAYRVGTMSEGTVFIDDSWGGGTMSRSAFRAMGKNSDFEGYGSLGSEGVQVQRMAIMAALGHYAKTNRQIVRPASQRFDGASFGGASILTNEAILAAIPTSRFVGPIVRRFGSAFRWAKGLLKHVDDAAPHLVPGPYGQVSRMALDAAAHSGGRTVSVVTRLTQAPSAGRALSVATGEGAEALAAAARAEGQLFREDIPAALIEELRSIGLVEVTTTAMGKVIGSELKFLPQATEFILPFLK